MPALLVSTMPSGSTRLTVAFLYSFPVVVLKSSACATEMNDRIRKLRSFVCIRCFDHRHSAVIYSFPARKIAQIPAHTLIEQLSGGRRFQNHATIAAGTAASTVIAFEAA